MFFWELHAVDIIKGQEQDYRIYASYADIYVNLNKYEEATPYLDSALMLEKSNYLLWEQALMVNYYNGDNEKVLKIGKEAEKYFKDKPNIYLISAFSGQELDLYETVGASTAHDITSPVTVADGELTLSFQTVTQNATVNAIVVKTAEATNHLRFVPGFRAARFVSSVISYYDLQGRRISALVDKKAFCSRYDYRGIAIRENMNQRDNLYTLTIRLR